MKYREDLRVNGNRFGSQPVAPSKTVNLLRRGQRIARAIAR